MITNQETIKKIKSFGLNTYEVKIWTALLSRGVSTAGELSDIANVPRSRSYDVLESLEKKGFVVMKLDKPIKYLAVPPKEAVEKVKKGIEKRTEEHISKITNQTFNSLINNLQDMYEGAAQQPDNVVAILKGNNNIQKHLEFLYKNAKKEIIVVTEKETENHLELLDNTTQKTKNIDITLFTNNKTTEQKRNTKPKTNNFNSRLCIVDDNVVLFPLSEKDIHPDYDLGIWAKNEQMAGFFKRLLELV